MSLKRTGFVAVFDKCFVNNPSFYQLFQQRIPYFRFDVWDWLLFCSLNHLWPSSEISQMP